MGIVFDTSALIAVERAGNRWERLAQHLRDDAAVIPSIVLAELLVGVQLAGDTKRAARRRSRINDLMSSCRLADFDREVATRWVEVFVHLR